tara:strand:- start:727 stop:945 length:219 start_codon:yes stop_codon:yes gene_type:complete
MELKQKSIKDKKMEEIKYLNNYKMNLTQFLIYNCAHKKNSKLQGRIRLNERQILNIQKELSSLEIFIYRLKH